MRSEYDVLRRRLSQLQNQPDDSDAEVEISIIEMIMKMNCDGNVFEIIRGVDRVSKNSVNRRIYSRLCSLVRSNPSVIFSHIQRIYSVPKIARRDGDYRTVDRYRDHLVDLQVLYQEITAKIDLQDHHVFG
jgi:hypothetical protein